jgi:hypothetical protein
MMLKALGDLGADWKASADDALRELQVTKHATYVQMSDEMAMEYGLIPDTRPPVVLTRRQRWRYARQEWTRRTRLRVGVALGSWIAGEDLAPGYYDDGE